VQAVVEGLSEEGSDGDWSETGQMLHEAGSQTVGKGQLEDTRLDRRQGRLMSVDDPNILGKFLKKDAPRVNLGSDVILATCELARNEGDNTSTGEGMLVDVPSIDALPRDQVLEEDRLVGQVGDVERRCEKVIDTGPNHLGPAFLRTRSGDLPVSGPGHHSNGAGQNSLGSKEDYVESDSCEEVGSCNDIDEEVPCTCERYKKVKKKKSRKKQLIYHQGNKFLKFQEYMQNKKGGGVNRKEGNQGTKKARSSVSTGSDSIHCSESKEVGGGGERNSVGIQLAVVLYQEGANQSPQLPDVFVPVGDDINPMVLGSSGHGVVDGDEEVGGGGRGEALSPGSHGGSSGDRDRSQAHHVIDILEDVGMQFNVDREEVVGRMMEMEERDRGEMSAWEQRQSVQ
jgi:hypothetical protein